MIEVKFENLHIIEDDNVIHILDLDLKYYKTLTNRASNEFFETLCTQLHLDKSKRIFLYHTDGYITEWKDGFKNLSEKDTDIFHGVLNRPFARFSSLRRKIQG